MTTRDKLWLGFGTLTALLALFSITVIIDLRGIERDLYEQSEVARPRSAAARQMEIHLLGYALAVRSYLHLGEARFLDEARAEAGWSMSALPTMPSWRGRRSTRRSPRGSRRAGGSTGRRRNAA